MSILLETDEGWVISHLKFFESIKVSPLELGESEDNTCEYLQLNPDLFEIREPFRDKLTIKGKIIRDFSTVNFPEVTNIVKSLSEEILSHSLAREIFSQGQNPAQPCDTNIAKADKECEDKGFRITSKNNFIAAQAAQNFFKTVKNIKWPEFHGQNPSSDISVISSLGGSCDKHEQIGLESQLDKFLFPPNSKFYCKDVSEMEKAFEEKAEEKFDLIILDPPWLNKFIRRKKRRQNEAGYQLIDDDGISKLPIKKLLKDDGIVVVWCTNANSHQTTLINEIFQKWDVHYQQTFYWLKVTKSGVPICPFNIENNKQPYEAVIIGRQVSTENEKLSSPDMSKTKSPKVIISIPSSINSHKPPLIKVLERAYPEKRFDRKCEIFARYLIPNFVSLGNEVVKLQHLSLFVQQNTENGK